MHKHRNITDLNTLTHEDYIANGHLHNKYVK